MAIGAVDVTRSRSRSFPLRDPVVVPVTPRPNAVSWVAPLMLRSAGSQASVVAK
jgi:hypothetical protein